MACSNLRIFMVDQGESLLNALQYRQLEEGEKGGMRGCVREGVKMCERVPEYVMRRCVVEGCVS